MRSKIIRFLKKDISFYFGANVIFSISTLVVNLCLPKILEPSFFEEFIYVFQMVLFMTTVSQIGIVVGLYQFLEKHRLESLNAYYTAILFVNLSLLVLGLIHGNIITSLLRLGALSNLEHLMFYLSIIASGIFLYNKGKNIADKSYKYMMKVAVTAFSIRLLVILALYFVNVTSLPLTLFLLFILPFIQDIKDYIVNSFRYINWGRLNKNLTKTFLVYSLKVWLIASLFNVSDRIFIILTKDINIQFTTAIAFASGFIGIISLFNASFTNYFLSNLSHNRIDGIQIYLRRLKKVLIPYIGLLLFICFVFSIAVYYIYPTLGMIAAVVLFITLLRSGLISYLGMFSLLSKVLDLLNIEITLNILRIIVVYSLCTFWHPQNLVMWYAVVMFTIPFPELILAIIINHKIKNQWQ